MAYDLAADTQNDMDVRLIKRDDPGLLAAAFADAGWNKPRALFERYLDEQQSGWRIGLVAEADGRLAGYVTLVRQPAYAHFRELGVPEIVDLNVLPCFSAGASAQGCSTGPKKRRRRWRAK